MLSCIWLNNQICEMWILYIVCVGAPTIFHYLLLFINQHFRIEYGERESYKQGRQAAMCKHQQAILMITNNNSKWKYRFGYMIYSFIECENERAGNDAGIDLILQMSEWKPFFITLQIVAITSSNRWWRMITKIREVSSKNEKKMDSKRTKMISCHFDVIFGEQNETMKLLSYENCA